MATFRSNSVTNTSTNINLQAVAARMVSVSNLHNAAIYVRFYDSDVATFQDTPVFTVVVAANAQSVIFPTVTNVFQTTTGLCARVVTDAAQNGNTAATTLPEIVVHYDN